MVGIPPFYVQERDTNVYSNDYRKAFLIGTMVPRRLLGNMPLKSICLLMHFKAQEISPRAGTFFAFDNCQLRAHAHCHRTPEESEIREIKSSDLDREPGSLTRI